jgi:predicted transcriptional regulator
MSTVTSTSTPSRSDRPRKPRGLNQEFLEIFRAIELELKMHLSLRRDSVTPMHRLIDDYAARNPLWQSSAEQLRTYKDIRNFLTHQTALAGDPVIVTRNSVEALRRIVDSLRNPEPVRSRFKKRVMCVSKRDHLGKVLQLAFECGFSQFPLVDDAEFGGLITENEVVRWLGHRVKQGSGEVAFGAVRVSQVVTEKDPTMVGMPIFRFISLDTPVDEAIATFATEQTLEVLLLTASGTKHTPIEGIITQWDAARFTSHDK